MSTVTDPIALEGTEGTEGTEGLDLSQDALEVHRDAPLSLLIGASAGVLSVAFLLRGVGSGSLLDWALCVLTAVVAAMHLGAVVDARAPLFVLDGLGVRVRRGAVWQGVSWPDVDHVEHTTRTSTLRDGSLTVVTTDGRRLGVRLSLSTRLIGADWHEVDGALKDLSGGLVPVVGPPDQASASESVTETVPEAATETIPETVTETVMEAVEVEAPVAVQRESRPALRAEVLLSPQIVDHAQVGPELSEGLDDEVSDVQVAAQSETIFIDAVHSSEAPPVEPVVGRQLAQARERIGITVEALAERTRIRSHVIEAIERDDFESCGGDFYARGHLRTLARVLGVDATELLALYDARYAHAPIDARKVFEAELAGAGTGARASSRGGLNWSVLVAAVMAVVLVWSVARLVMDGPVPLSDQPVLNGSPGGKATLAGATTKVPVSLTAATGGARVIVRDGRQQVVFDAQLAFMQTAELTAAPPVRISTTDGGLLVTVDGVEEGALGATGQDAQRTYVP